MATKPMSQEARDEAEIKRAKQERTNRARIEREVARQLRAEELAALPKGLVALPGVATLGAALARLEAHFTAEVAQLRAELDEAGMADEFTVEQPALTRFWRGLRDSLRRARYAPPLSPEELGSLVNEMTRYISATVNASFDSAVLRSQATRDLCRNHLNEWERYALKGRNRVLTPDDRDAALLYGDEAEAREAMGWGPEHADHVQIGDGIFELRYPAPRED